MKKNNHKYLITGGTGFIGAELAKKLDGNVTIVSRKIPTKATINGNLKFIKKAVKKITAKDLEQIDVIYHCASTVDNYNVLTKPMLDVDTNIKGTIHLLE